MNQVVVAVVVALVAGAAGAFTYHLLQGGHPAAAGAAADEPGGGIEQALREIKDDLAALRDPPATLTSRAPEVAAARGTLPADAASVEALLERIDQRVGKTVEEKLAASQAEERGQGSTRSRGGRRRVSLADAARELELSGQQEDELRRIFEDTQNRFFKLMAGPDQSPEEVKREVLEAVKAPGGTQRLMGKYLPKVMTKMGEVLAIQGDREAAIQKAVGPEKARAIQRDYSIEEDDILGLRGSEVRFGVEARGGN